MRGADLKEAILINTNFGRAFLDEADLREAFLFYSEPREFWRYDKEEEDKAEKDLEGAYLTCANLSGINVAGIDLRETVLTNAILNNTIFDENQISYLEEKYDLQNASVYRNESHDIITYKEYRKRYK